MSLRVDEEHQKGRHAAYVKFNVDVPQGIASEVMRRALKEIFPDAMICNVGYHSQVLCVEWRESAKYKPDAPSSDALLGKVYRQYGDPEKRAATLVEQMTQRYHFFESAKQLIKELESVAASVGNSVRETAKKNIDYDGKIAALKKELFCEMVAEFDRLCKNNDCWKFEDGKEVHAVVRQMIDENKAALAHEYVYSGPFGHTRADVFGSGEAQTAFLAAALESAEEK